MLFNVAHRFYADLNLVLLYLPDECNIDNFEDKDLPLDLVPDVTTSTEHVTEGGGRYAHASATAYLSLEPYDGEPSFQYLPEPVKKAYQTFSNKLGEVLKGQEWGVQLRQSVSLAYQVEAGLQRTPPRVHLELTVDQPYSVKGLRTIESQRQRAEDAAALAGHKLRTSLLREAKIALARMQEVLIVALEAFNAQQVKPLLTQIDLGLWPQKAHAKEVDAAHEQYQQMQNELAKLQIEADMLWKAYSETYKKSVAKDFANDFPNDSLLEIALTNNINRFNPLRYL